MKKQTIKHIQEQLAQNPNDLQLQSLLERKLKNRAKTERTLQQVRQELAKNPSDQSLEDELRRKLLNRAKAQRAITESGPLQTPKAGLYHKAPKKRRAVLLELGVPKNVPFKGRQERILKNKEIMIEKGLIKRSTSKPKNRNKK